MKNKVSKWWIVAVVFIPFFLMFCLHIGIALGTYFKIDFNVPNVDASTWFVFYSSYLGGVMTLAGVMITIEHERKIHKYEKALQDIENEKQQIGQAIREINTMLPSMLYQQFNSLPITPTGYNGNDIAAIRCRISEELQKASSHNISLMFFTDVYSQNNECAVCKNPCKIKESLPKLQKTYETIENKILDALVKIDAYIQKAEANACYTALVRNFEKANALCISSQKEAEYSEDLIREYQNHIVELQPLHDEIQKILVDMSDIIQKKIPQLMALGREYIAVKQTNAYHQCFGKEREKK